jgi:hypothetical protein
MADQVLRDVLVAIARHHETTTYGKISTLRGLAVRDGELFRQLDEISTDEHNNRCPLLSAVVVREDTEMPGDGFFRLARSLGVEGAEVDNTTLFGQERGRCWNYCANDR